MDAEQTLRELAQEMPDRSARGLAETIFRMIRSDILRPGDRLPTVRTTAAHLGMSPSSVAEAWRTMLDAQAIQTKRRGGTFIVGPPTPATPERYERLLESARGMAELGRPSADPHLWPDATEAFAFAVEQVRADAENDPVPMTPSLYEAVRPSWPFEPGALMATNGGLDGLALALRTLVAPGERVLVAEPTEIIVLDLLDSMRCMAVPIPHDEYGPRPDALARELANDPPVFIHQSGPSSPLGRSTTKARMQELAAVVKGHPTHVVEMCPHPYFATATPSMGSALPEQVVHVRWYGRSHGADILVGVVGGNRDLLRRMWLMRGYQAQWTSRYLQHALAYLLTDEQSIATVDQARQVYDQRRQGLVAALARAGIVSRSNAGTSVWIPVPDEDSAWMHLAQRGYAAQRGGDFHLDAGGDPHLRVSIAFYRDDLDALARTLIEACTRADPFPAP